jgi:hypothetical protein
MSASYANVLLGDCVPAASSPASGARQWWRNSLGPADDSLFAARVLQPGFVGVGRAPIRLESSGTGIQNVWFKPADGDQRGIFCETPCTVALQGVSHGVNVEYRFTVLHEGLVNIQRGSKETRVFSLDATTGKWDICGGLPHSA